LFLEAQRGCFQKNLLLNLAALCASIWLLIFPANSKVHTADIKLAILLRKDGMVHIN
jgi:hypothetical protein